MASMCHNGQNLIFKVGFNKLKSCFFFKFKEQFAVLLFPAASQLNGKQLLCTVQLYLHMFNLHENLKSYNLRYWGR